MTPDQERLLEFRLQAVEQAVNVVADLLPNQDGLTEVIEELRRRFQVALATVPMRPENRRHPLVMGLTLEVLGAGSPDGMERALNLP